MKLRVPLLFRHAVYNLQGGFLVRPLIIAVALGLAGGLLSTLETAEPEIARWVPFALFPSRSDPQVAQIILGDIAGAVMTVVSIVFAILLMTLTLASMQFSPRIIVSFAKDHVTQWTLGIFLGTFSYCIAALPTAHLRPHPTEPVLTVMGAMFLALACVAWLLFFIHHISEAISVNHIVNRIANETEAVIDSIMPYPIREAARHVKMHLAPPGQDEVPILSEVAGYIRFSDANLLLRLAKEHRICIRVLRRVGHFVPAGVPLLMIEKGERVAPEGNARLLGAFDIGPTRTLQQDVEFGVLQIVDIALKAISPAVNDPTTAIACIDQLSRIMIRFGMRDLPDALLYDPPGKLRLSIPWVDFDGLMDSAFEQIRLYARGDLAVSMRILRAYSDIAATIPDEDVRKTLYARGLLVAEGCATRLPEKEMAELNHRLAELQQTTLLKG